MNDYLNEMFSLQGKWSIVTGAARGNGFAISEALIKAGSSVVMIDILENELTKSSEELACIGNCLAKTCDVTDRQRVKTLIDEIVEKTGRIDVLVNNAGISLGGDILEYQYEDWDATYKVNLLAPFLLCQEVGKIMKRQKSGSIINITSLNAELAFPNNPSYVSFKGGLRQLTRAMALDLGKYGIRANNIGPGYFKTNMTKKSYEDPRMNKERCDRTVLNRWGDPKDLAGAVIFLASSSSSYVTGQDIYVDGGWMIKGL